MAISLKKSVKQLQIDKANASIVLILSIAAVISAFSAVAIKSILSQQAYQSKVISTQNKTLKTAKADLVAAKNLSGTYEAFNNASPNILEGSSVGTGTQDGSNSKIILDALPSEYDFPALISSLQKIVGDRGFKVGSISGSDDATQADLAATSTPTPVEIPFDLAVTGSYTGVQDLVNVFDRSTRPIAIGTLLLSGSDSEITVSISAKTYFQPGKKFVITSKVVPNGKSAVVAQKAKK